MKMVFLGVVTLVFFTGCMMLPMVGMMSGDHLDENQTKSRSSHSH